MTIEASLAACEETVRRVDPDRYVSALFAPAERRPLLFALYAFNHELAHVGETVKEPMLGEIRLEWWREAVEGARDGHPRAHDVARGLAEAFARVGPPIALFEAMIAARQHDVGSTPFPDLAALETYSDQTSGNVMRLAAAILDEHRHGDEVFRHAGVAYALAGFLRAEPALASRGKSRLGGIARESIIAKALEHHAAARRSPKPGHVLPAVLPAALVPLYAKQLSRGRAADVPLFRRQWAMLMASIRGRV